MLGIIAVIIFVGLMIDRCLAAIVRALTKIADALDEQQHASRASLKVLERIAEQQALIRKALDRANEI